MKGNIMEGTKGGRFVCMVDDLILCDGNNGLGAYGMDLVHNGEAGQSATIIWL